jgi:hypothetical protein
VLLNGREKLCPELESKAFELASLEDASNTLERLMPHDNENFLVDENLPVLVKVRLLVRVFDDDNGREVLQRFEGVGPEL